VPMFQAIACVDLVGGMDLLPGELRRRVPEADHRQNPVLREGFERRHLAADLDDLLDGFGELFAGEASPRSECRYALTARDDASAQEVLADLADVPATSSVWRDALVDSDVAHVDVHKVPVVARPVVEGLPLAQRAEDRESSGPLGQCV